MDQREAFLDTASEGFEFTRRMIEHNVQEVESGKYENIHQSAGWYSIIRNGNTIKAKARVRGNGEFEYKWRVSA